MGHSRQLKSIRQSWLALYASSRMLLTSAHEVMLLKLLTSYTLTALQQSTWQA